MDAIRPALAVVATLCVGAAGCGGDDSTAFPPFPEVGECVSGSERPIRVEEALEVLRDHGFAMNARDTMCAEGEAARLSNVPPENDVWLSCIVLVEPRSEGDVPVVIGAVDLERPDVEPVQREAGNVHCSLIADAGEDEPPERLGRAIAELERVAEG